MLLMTGLGFGLIAGSFFFYLLGIMRDGDTCVFNHDVWRCQPAYTTLIIIVSVIILFGGIALVVLSSRLKNAERTLSK